jgi:cytochrome c553
MRFLGPIAAAALVVATAAHAQAPDGPLSRFGRDMPRGDAVRGAVLAERNCMECHTMDGGGRGIHRPNLAGQQYVYLLKQLLAFKASADGDVSDAVLGWRWHPRLGSMLASFSDQDFADLAAYFSGLACIQPTARPRPRPTIAERCAFCHGTNGLGIYPVVPNIAGQKELYLLRQLDAFRAGGNAIGTGDNAVRRSNPMMNKQVHVLSESDVILLASYFAALPCR